MDLEEALRVGLKCGDVLRDDQGRIWECDAIANNAASLRMELGLARGGSEVTIPVVAARFRKVKDSIG